MNLVCQQCEKTIEYSGERPRFCGFCGAGLSTISMAGAEATHTYQSTATPAQVDAPASIGPFQLGDRLGAGGMGVVFKAVHNESGQNVAVKILSQTGTQDVESVDRFQREGQIAASISHPRSTFVYAAGEQDGKCYIAMELMPGGTLKDLVEQSGPLPISKAVDYILDMIEGLSAAHDVGIIHRDVKPSNCFVDEGGRVKVGDYGLSKSLLGDAALTRTGAFMGTPQYAAPEQITGGKVDRRTDVYAVGGTLFYLLTGRAPFTGDAAKVIAGIAAEPAPKIRTLNNGVPLDLEAIIAQALDKNKEKRQHDLEELHDALLPFSSRGNAMADLGRRLAGYVLDTLASAVLTTYLTLIAMITTLVLVGQSQWFDRSSSLPGMIFVFAISMAQLVSVVAYFGIFEGIVGWSPGKRLLGLKTVGPKGGKPGLWRASVRAFIVPGIVSCLITMYTLASMHGFSETPQDSWQLFLLSLKQNLATLVGWSLILACFVTARKKNGYRGIHEFVTRTRVVRVSKRSSVNREKAPQTLPKQADLYEQFAGYRVVGVLGEFPGGKAYVAIEEKLARQVWIYCFDDPTHNPFVSDARKTLGRSTRQRYLGKGQSESGKQFAVVESVSGSPLFGLPKTKKLQWDDAVDMLDELTAEFDAGIETESLPKVLTTEQIWLDSNGQLKIVELPIWASNKAQDVGSQDVMTVLKSFVDEIKKRCIVPGRWIEIFDQFYQRKTSSEETITWIRSQLSKDRAQGVSWGWDDRLGVLAISTSIEALLAYICSMLLAFGIWSLIEFELIPEVGSVLLGLSLWGVLLSIAVVVGYLLKGGLAFWVAGVEVRTLNGRKASKWHIALRNLVAWLPVAGFLAFSASSIADSEARFEMANKLATQQPGIIVSSNTFPLITAFFGLIVVACAIYSLVRTQRGVQDLICQTRIGPR